MFADHDPVQQVHCDPLYLRALEHLRSRGGCAAAAAAKADAFLAFLTESSMRGREKFRFTRKGEYRIKNCRKVDLGCGYRIVCIQKGPRLVLLYIGTHDDCFRWIERRRKAEYDLDGVTADQWVDISALPPRENGQESTHEEDRLADTYEASLMERIDDAVLRRVFSGLIEGQKSPFLSAGRSGQNPCEGGEDGQETDVHPGVEHHSGGVHYPPAVVGHDRSSAGDRA